MTRTISQIDQDIDANRAGAGLREMSKPPADRLKKFAPQLWETLEALAEWPGPNDALRRHASILLAEVRCGRWCHGRLVGWCSMAGTEECNICPLHGKSTPGHP